MTEAEALMVILAIVAIASPFVWLAGYVIGMVLSAIVGAVERAVGERRS